MDKTMGELTAEEFEELVERTIDRRLVVWLTQLTDALEGEDDEGSAEFRPEFAVSLRRSVEQARSGQGIDLKAFRGEIGR